MNSRSFIVAVAVLLLVVSLVLFPAPIAIASGYVPHQGDYFSYYEVENLGNGTGNYAGYTEHTVVNGTERMNSVSSGIVSANYSYSYEFSSGTGSAEAGTQAGDYTFSSNSFLYLNGTDDQTGYVNPTVWFFMNASLPEGGTFSILNTQMTIMSKNYTYYLPSLNKDVATIFSQGSSSYVRNDSYGVFTATYTWKSYFDPSTGYIVGYVYNEHDTNSSGTSFTYSDDLYVTSTSYPLTPLAGAGSTATTSVAQSVTSSLSSSATSTATGAPPPATTQTQYLVYAAGIVIVILIVGILAYALSRRNRSRLPRHSPQEGGPPSPGGGRGYPPTQSPPPEIDLTPKEQPPVQQVVIKEVAKVRCSYCGALIDSTARTCPQCGAPRN